MCNRKWPGDEASSLQGGTIFNGVRHLFMSPEFMINFVGKFIELARPGLYHIHV